MCSKRVIDGVPMHLHHHLLLGYCKELNDLPMKLGAALSGTGRPTNAPGAHSRTGSALQGADGHAEQWQSEGLSESEEEGDGATAEAGSSSNSTSRRPRPLLLDAARLMAEDESTAQRRAQLTRQLQQLQGVRKILSVF